MKFVKNCQEPDLPFPAVHRVFTTDNITSKDQDHA